LARWSNAWYELWPTKRSAEPWTLGWLAYTAAALVLTPFAGERIGWLPWVLASPIIYRAVDLILFHVRLFTFKGANRLSSHRRTVVLEALSLGQVVLGTAYFASWRIGIGWLGGIEEGVELVVFHSNIPSTEPLTRWLVGGVGVVSSLMILTGVIAAVAGALFSKDN
jgi:hypothetical protein